MFGFGRVCLGGCACVGFFSFKMAEDGERCTDGFLDCLDGCKRGC